MSPTPSKRRASINGPSISPPPLKRKVQSAISKNAVANFFTPTSQKPKDRLTWSERSPNDDSPPTLLVGRYDPAGSQEEELRFKRRKIAAFDLDSTLIVSASGKKHADDPADWKWWDDSVPVKLRDLYNNEGYRVVILTNQGGLTLHPDPNAKGPKKPKDRVALFKQKVGAVLSQLDIPLTLYAATGKDPYRKPRPGMWREMCEDYELSDGDIDRENSMFVGDAGGRKAHLKGGKAVPMDFSCSDRNLADNIRIAYKTPEEFFLGEDARDFVREFDLTHYPFEEDSTGVEHSLLQKSNAKEILLFCGPPGGGKSTFYWRYLKPLGYERVNQDVLKSKDKCFKVANEYLQRGDSVAVDNTNPDADTRAQWIELAAKNNVPIKCLWFNTPVPLAEHNDAVRALNQSLNPESRTGLPKLAFNSFSSRYKEPRLKEGFQDIIEVKFKFRGSKEEYEIWGKYWL
ncbi:Polynucleotide kinase 3 phosphatase [Pleurostoma richardsiae]|uniref:Polynucleotide kinase 3 phosphatase n=1 Tax=Pleurostoma richardsiae TaxID=41990 RepID=A0AA38VBH1_9PEZI|nr:Polynucleotide kinase 3 phosphatase [Pleurostoma richardsiae]